MASEMKTVWVPKIEEEGNGNRHDDYCLSGRPEAKTYWFDESDAEIQNWGSMQFADFHSGSKQTFKNDTNSGDNKTKNLRKLQWLSSPNSNYMSASFYVKLDHHIAVHYGLNQFNGKVEDWKKSKPRMHLPGVYGFEHYYRWPKRDDYWNGAVQIEKCGLHYLDPETDEVLFAKLTLDEASAPKTSQWPDRLDSNDKDRITDSWKGARWTPSNKDTRRFIIERQLPMVGLSLGFFTNKLGGASHTRTMDLTAFTPLWGDCGYVPLIAAARFEPWTTKETPKLYVS